MLREKIVQGLKDGIDIVACAILFAFVIAGWLTSSCGTDKRAKDAIPAVSPSVADRALYHETERSIADHHVYGGFGVVTLKPDGQPEHLGEALIWGGTFLYAASCETGRAVSQSMADMVDRLGGQIERVEPLGEYANGREATLDGMIGLMAGVARRVVDCDEAGVWASPWSKLVEWQNAHGSKLNAGSPGKIDGEFKYLRDLIAWKLGAGQPAESRRAEFQKTAANWPALVLASHLTGIGSDACFRVNLSWTALTASELLGDEIGQTHRDRFCAATTTMGIPLADSYCGRQSLDSWLEGYVPDEWEYRHQRCAPPWESPDGDGNVNPRLDLLMGLVVRHGWQNLQN